MTPWNELQGDVDCDTNVNSIDSLKLLGYAASLTVSQTEPCPDIGSQRRLLAVGRCRARQMYGTDLRR